MDQRARVAPQWSQRAGLTGNKSAASSLGRRHQPDRWLLILTAILLGFGLMVVYSISPGLSASEGLSQGYFVTKQILAVALAIVAFMVAMRVPIDWWRASARWLVWVALIGSLLVLFMPINESYPAHRWVRLGSFSFQIAELIKLALVVAAAKFLTDRWRVGQLKDSSKTLYPIIAVLAVIGVVVAKLQSDLGSAGVMVAMLGIMAYVAGLPLKRVMLVSGLILLLGVLAVASSSYRRDRLDTFLHPGKDCSGSGYQACQALISVGSGGLMGLGLGYSVQAYGYLPEASNDSIFAIISEKFGFIGSFLIIVGYLLLMDRLRKIAQNTADQFCRLLVVGILAWISTQMIINIGAMIGLLPLKGITLPLISQGGTSIVFFAIALGIVFQISRYTSYQEVDPDLGSYDTKNDNNTNERWRNRRTHSTVTFTRPRT